MGIRRRRKRINTILTQIDRRLKSVELRRVPRIIRDGTITKRQLSVELQESLERSESSSTATPGSVAPTFTAQPYVDIVKIVYAGFSASTGRDRARIYFTADPGIDVGDRFRLASTRSAFDNPSKTSPYEALEVGVVDGYSTVVYAPRWDRTITGGAVTYDKGIRIQWENVSLAGTVIDGPVTRYTKGQIKYFTFGNAAAGFASRDDYLNGPRYPSNIETTDGNHVADWTYDVGDLINLDGLGSNFDGVHKITSKQVSPDGLEITLQFDFKTVLTAPVTMPSSNGSLRPAAGRFLRDGETYTDTSVTPAITYVWDDALQKWWNIADPLLPENLLIDDGIAPAAPTSLGGTSSGYVSGTVPRSRVILNWTAPTKNSDDTNLTDFLQYRVYYKYTETGGDYVEITQTKVPTATIIDLPPLKELTFVVTAEDKVGNESVYSAPFTITTSRGSLELDVPSVPILTTKFGTVTITWDGKNFLGGDLTGSSTLAGVEVHRSTTSDFTAGASTLIDAIAWPNTFTVDTAVEYSTTYYYKLIAYDYSGNKTAASAQASIMPKALVDTDMIASTLTYWPFVGEVVSASALATGAVSASKLAQNAINSSNFSTVIEANALTADVIAAGAIGADEIAAGAIIAGKIGADAVTANTIAALSISAGKIQANAIETDKINAGAITAVKISTDAIEADKIKAGAITTDKILVTDTFKYRDNTSTFEVRIGSGAITAPYTGVSAGLGFWQGPTQFGYLATWGAGIFEIGSSFSSAYMSIGLNGAFNLLANFANGYDFSGTTFRSTAAVKVTRASTSAFLVEGSSLAGDKVVEVDTTTGKLIVSNGAVPNTTNTLDVFGRIRATGTITASTTVSSIRYKSDIREYKAPIELLDITPKVYKYNNHILYDSWPNSYAKTLPEYSEDHLGAIAEDFIAIGLDYLVSRDEEGRPEALDYSKIAVLLIPYIKDLYKQIEELKKED